MPIIEIFSLTSSSPRLWPMGVTTERPRAIELTQGVPWVVELTWDDEGRLASTKRAIRGRRVAEHRAYVWRGKELDKIRELDPSGDEEGTQEEVWTWEKGRPVAVKRPRPDGPQGPSEAWEWSADGTELVISESSDQGVVTRRTITLDAKGHMTHSEDEHMLDGAKRIFDVSWSPEGRLLEAREGARVLGFKWDDAGRLIAQTDSNVPGVDVWQYRY